MRLSAKFQFSLLAAAICVSPAAAVAPAQSVVKVVNGANSASGDTGWVIYRGPASAPTLRRYALDAGGNFTASAAVKLKTAGLGAANTGLLFDVGGITFAPCPVAANPSRCAQSAFGATGVGLGYGQLTFGGAGSQAGGWVNDASITVRPSNIDQNPGSIAGVAADPANGAYAVGWDLNPSAGKVRGIILTLNSTDKSFTVVSRTDLGTLGGGTSQAFAISKDARHVTGIAEDGLGHKHAVYALSTASAWTDISASFPAEVLQSRGLAASSNGLIAGSATVKRNIGPGGAPKSVDIGFVYNTNTSNVVFFEAPGTDVVPLKILSDGRVVGNLVAAAPGAVKEQHPFMYDGTVHDYGKMNIGANPAFGCRVNKPNNLGELVGTCIPNDSSPYGVRGVAFYLDTNAAVPAFVDLNATLHSNANSPIPAIKPYTFGAATSIDDQHEVVLMATKIAGASDNTAVFLASKQAYNP